MTDTDAETEREGAKFRCEDCGSTIETSPMRPATCVHCGGEFEIVTVKVDLPLLLRSVDRGDEVRLRLASGGFITGRVTGVREDDGTVGLTIDGEQSADYAVTANRGEKLAEVGATEIEDVVTGEPRSIGRVVGVLNVTDHPDALDDHADDRVVLVGCGQRKASHPVPARQLYESAYFDKKHQYAEQPGVDAWFILSAEYGLVHPDERIEPYDTHIDDVDADDWSAFVQSQMPDLSGATIEVVAGEAYFQALDIALDIAAGTSGSIERPVEGLGIGEQMAWLKEHTTEEADDTGSAELTEADFPSVDELEAHGDPVTCRTCNRTLPGDPTLEVECPVCGAEPGTKCSRPSEHSGNFVHPHAKRDRLALATGVTPPCPEGTDPMTPEEAAADLGIECEIDETDPFAYQWPWFVDGVVDDEQADTAAEAATESERAHDVVVSDGGDESGEETRLVNMAARGREGVTPIDRSTQFGNPFQLEKDGGDYTREQSIEAYRVWFAEQLEDDEFRAAVEDLRGKTLGCWCAPKGCHGDVVLEYLREGEVDVPETAPTDLRPSEDTTEQATLAPEEDDALQEESSNDDLDGCVAIIDTTGEPCGNSVTSDASDTAARLCGTHAKASRVKRADAVERTPDPDLRDRLVEAGMNGAHAYYLACLTDSAEVLWCVVTDLTEVGGGEVTYEPSTLATLASTVALLEAVDAEGHPLAYDGCVAVIDSGAMGENYRCGSGSYAHKLLCGTHQDTSPENLRTVFDTDAPDDLRIEDWSEVSIGDDRFLAVEQRDGDLLAISTPEYEYVRLEGFGYLVDELDTDAGGGRDEREGNQELTSADAGDVQEASSEEIDGVGEPAFLDEHPEESLVRVELEDGRVYTGEVVDHGTGGWRNDARSIYINADAVRGSLMVYCDRQEDGMWGDLQALDKLIGAYDAPDAGEDALGPVASIEQLVDDPDREGVLEELVALLEAGLAPAHVLDYWAAEDTDQTYGEYTQKEWAEVRGVSRQAVGANIGSARDTLTIED
jgi:Zn finger protein HypA/HybF involved in hydrogenase expression